MLTPLVGVCALVVANCLGVTAEHAGVTAEPAGSNPLENYHAAKQAGEFETAAERLKQLYLDEPQDLSLEFASLARSANGHLASEGLAELYRLAADSLEQVTADTENASQRFLIRVIAATQLAKHDRRSEASEVLIEALGECVAVNVSPQLAREKTAVELTLQLAHALLTNDQPAEALMLYGALTRYFDAFLQMDTEIGRRGEQYALALMGLGWATAGAASHELDTGRLGAGNTRHGDDSTFNVAARRLMRFVDRFPTHPDAAGSAAMRVYCLSKCLESVTPERRPSGEKIRSIQTSSEDRLDVAIDEYLQRWPDHSAAVSVVQIGLSRNVGEKAQYASVDSPDRQSENSIRDSVQRWLTRKDTTDDWPIRFVGQALLVAGDTLPPILFENAVTRIVSEDHAGQITADLLGQLTQTSQTKLAERVAASVISKAAKPNAPRAIDAACRWAAREGKWGMLAMQATEMTLAEAPSIEDESIAAMPSCRLFAESLTRTGKPAEALRWWSQIVDQSDKVDFTTLLRCAESAVATAPVDEARVRIEQLRRSIEPEPDDSQSPSPKSFWCDLLAGDLAIRKVQFDKARNHFKAVIRAPTATAPVQGRAQWMIGETYFMQKRYSDAIDAYRKVDGIDANGSFVAASLVQAGKSFEQLGRTREAGICYGTLIGRFGNTAYATEAKRRMTALPALDNATTSRKR